MVISSGVCGHGTLPDIVRFLDSHTSAGTEPPHSLKQHSDAARPEAGRPGGVRPETHSEAVHPAAANPRRRERSPRQTDTLGSTRSDQEAQDRFRQLSPQRHAPMYKTGSGN